MGLRGISHATAAVQNKQPFYSAPKQRTYFVHVGTFIIVAVLLDLRCSAVFQGGLAEPGPLWRLVGLHKSISHSKTNALRGISKRSWCTLPVAIFSLLFDYNHTCSWYFHF
jgi:hypothetical protein